MVESVPPAVAVDSRKPIRNGRQVQVVQLARVHIVSRYTPHVPPFIDSFLERIFFRWQVAACRVSFIPFISSLGHLFRSFEFSRCLSNNYKLNLRTKMTSSRVSNFALDEK